MRFTFPARRLRLSGIFAAVVTAAPYAAAAAFYVAPTGNDADPGTVTAPFATLMRAQAAVSTGDTVYVRGGTYSTFTIAATDANYNYVHRFNKAGISWAAYPGETPLFDFASVPTNRRVCGFHITAGGISITGFHVTGVQVGAQKQSECFRIDGSAASCDFYDCVARDNAANGFYFTNRSRGSCTRCDAYNNIGSTSASVGNTDGFGAHGNGVVFRYCRSWNNSDDGYDCISSPGANTFDHCWAYDMRAGGDSNGFKIGGFGADPATVPPSPVPAHTVRYCLSADNAAHGFYANHQPGKSATWTHNSAYGNSSGNYNMLERTSDMAADIPGFREVLHQNLAYSGITIENDNNPPENVTDNSWTRPGVTVDATYFLSLDATQMTATRGPARNLPTFTFMHLAPGSDLSGLGCFDSPAAPSAPTNVAAIRNAAGQIELSWTPSAGATEYYVLRATAASGPFTAVGARIADTRFTDVAPVAGADFYQVAAINDTSYDAGTSIAARVGDATSGPPRVLRINDPAWSGSTNLIDVSHPRSSSYPARLSNVSVRGSVSAAQPLIAGAVIDGNGTLPMLVRAIGPTLASFGVTNALLVPTLRIFRGADLLAETNDLSGALTPAARYVGAFDSSLNPAGYRDAGLVGFASKGGLTVHCATADVSGVALVEFYDAGASPTTAGVRFTNLSARGQVEAGEGLLVLGFVVAGDGPVKVLLRGGGPSLTRYGISNTLTDPTIELFTADGTSIARNDDWQSGATPVSELQAAGTGVGAFDFASSKEAALLLTLTAGSYTLQLRDAANATGVGIAEVYEVR